jgi:excisionase family DNA binding protein
MWEDVPPFLTVEQAGRLLQLGRSKSYELTVEYERTDGESGMPFVWFGNQKRIPRDALARWVDSRLQHPPR